jgi:hypothetical protein
MCEKIHFNKYFRNQAFAYLLQLRRMTLYIWFSFHVRIFKFLCWAKVCQVTYLTCFKGGWMIQVLLY